MTPHRNSPRQFKFPCQSSALLTTKHVQGGAARSVSNRSAAVTFGRSVDRTTDLTRFETSIVGRNANPTSEHRDSHAAPRCKRRLPDADPVQTRREMRVWITCTPRASARVVGFGRPSEFGEGIGEFGFEVCLPMIFGGAFPLGTGKLARWKWKRWTLCGSRIFGNSNCTRGWGPREWQNPQLGIEWEEIGNSK